MQRLPSTTLLVTSANRIRFIGSLTCCAADSLLLQIVLPSYSVWFDSSKMHQIEKSAFPEYAQTPADVGRYISIRNKIVETYRDFPQVPLYATDCLRHVSADASTVFRVHSFLDYWGIINTESDARVRFSKAMFCLSNFDTPRGIAKRLSEQGSSKNIRNCTVTGEPLQRMHYSSQKWQGVYLSPLAISTGMLPLHMAASDFKKKVLSDPLTASK